MKTSTVKLPLAALLLSVAATASLSAQITVSVENRVLNGSASGGSGSGAGVLSSSNGTIASNTGLPTTTYTVSNLDFTTLGGTASETFEFTVSYAATSDGITPASTQFTGFGNIGVTGGVSNDFVDGTETLTATIALTSSSFAGLSLDGFTFARAGGLNATRTGDISWATGSFAVSQGNTIATIDPLDGITAFTVTAPGSQINFEGFGAEFTAVPEPSIATLLAALGAGAFVVVRRRRAA